MTFRVAIGGFLHETNTFAPSKATYRDFVEGGGYMPMAHGKALLEGCRDINLGVSGAVAEAQLSGWELLPLLWAGAIPSAHVTREAYENIADELIRRLAQSGRLDGVLLDLHGAMVCEHLDDGEGELLARVREVVGPDVSIAACLDLHGNVTARMVEQADVLVGFRTYPHVDMAETGRRTARALGELMRVRAPLAKAFLRLPYLVPIPWQTTDLEPAAGLYRLVAQQEREEVLSTSLFMGFPAADFPECGPAVVTYARSQALAEAAAERIGQAYAEAETGFAGRVFDAAQGVAEAQRLLREGSRGPIVLADTQDNPGAGGDSNTTGMLRALVEAHVEGAALGLMVDPAAAASAHQAGEGAEIEVALGGTSGIAGDSPYTVNAKVERLSDGRLLASGDFYGGARLDLGPSACLRIGGVRVVVTSRKAQMADREMFRFMGVVPEEAGILVVKSSTHFRADFAPIASKIMICKAPGPMPFSPADLAWRRLESGIRLSPLGEAFRPAR